MSSTQQNTDYGLINFVQSVIAIASLLLLSIPFMRRFSYELFLRLHQSLAIVALLALWRHLSLAETLSRVYVLIAGGLLIVTMTFELLHFIFRNFSLRGESVRVDVILKSGEHLDPFIQLNICLPRKIKVRAGQYINICIPSTSSFAILQSHPFAVTSWKDCSITCLVKPDHGLTRRLLTVAHKPRLEEPWRGDYRRAYITGPHGPTVDLGNYGSVAMIATGFGIVAQQSYIRELIQGYNKGIVCTRRVHVIWQFQEWGKLLV